MTIGGWIAFLLLAACLIALGAFVAICADSLAARIATPIICGVICVVLLVSMLWYYNNTASGQRALVDQESELSNGMDRVIRVYTANGDLIAEFEGRIDIEGNDGGYVLFDYQGKRYTYYNCFVESIAEIGG